MNEQQSKVTTGNQDSTDFSTVWKSFFHGMENRRGQRIFGPAATITYYNK